MADVAASVLARLKNRAKESGRSENKKYASPVCKRERRLLLRGI